eukprot:SAG31_NODE_2003_length_6688_cov_2.812415_7_plen_101_part_00
MVGTIVLLTQPLYVVARLDLRQHTAHLHALMMMMVYYCLSKGVMASGQTGAYTPHATEDEGGKLMREIMEEFGLFAPQTFFQPQRQGGDHKGFGNAHHQP